MQISSYTVTQESFASIAASYSSPDHKLNWNLLFSLPDWLNVWWQSFDSETELYLASIRYDGKVAGIAPLQIKDRTAYFIGNADVCDYLDFIVAPGLEREFFTALLDDLGKKGVTQMDLVSLRSDSSVLTSLVPLAQERKYHVNCQKADVSVEMDLPNTWEEYLLSLDGKQRHEVKRKQNRLENSGLQINYKTLEDNADIVKAIDIFLKLFTESRHDKAAFMTPKMESFFRSMSDTMSRAGMLKLGSLELNGKISAMVMYFDFRDGIYLYNSGYDPEYNELSVGLISKIFCIRESIQKGRKKFDFLKGAESYKYYLGGNEVPISRCIVTI